MSEPARQDGTATGGRREGGPTRTFSRTVALLVVALLVVGTVAAGGAGTAAARDPNVTVTGVDVSPANPSPGEPVTLSVSIYNSESTNLPFEVAGVWLRERDGDVLVKEFDFGTIGPGERLTVPLTTAFSKPGVKHLRVNVRGDDVDVDYPVTVVVESATPRLDTNYDDLFASADNDVTVTVSNGRTDAIRDVQVTIRGEDLHVDEPTRSAAGIAGGAARNFSFVVSSDATGTRDAELRVRYTTPTGVTRELGESRSFYFKPAGGTAVTIGNVTQSPDRVAPGAPFDLTFTVANRGEDAVQNLDFTLSLAGTAIDAGPAGSEVYVSDLTGGESKTIAVTLRTNPGSASGVVAIPLQYSYITADGQRNVRKTTLTATVLGTPSLQAFLRETERTDGGQRLTLDVANVGDGPARSASVTVEGTDGSTSYYLGDIEAGSYESAVLPVTSRGSSYEATLTYSNAFNEQTSITQSISVPEPDRSLPLTELGVVVGLLVVGVSVWGWRRWER